MNIARLIIQHQQVMQGTNFVTNIFFSIYFNSRVIGAEHADQSEHRAEHVSDASQWLVDVGGGEA